MAVGLGRTTGGALEKETAVEVLVVVVRVVVSFVVVSDAVILEVCFLSSACSLVFHEGKDVPQQ
jgi:hypothetical protein